MSGEPSHSYSSQFGLQAHTAESLPRGRHRLPAIFVAQSQRERLIEALLGSLAEHGYADLTVGRVVARAGVSRATFYENFEGKLEAVLEVYRLSFERLLGVIVRACYVESEWPLGVRAAIRAVLDLAAAEPHLMRLLAVDGLACDRAVDRTVLASREQLATLLAGGRRRSPNGFLLPEITEGALIGAIASIIGTRLTQGGLSPDTVDELEPQVVQLTLTPYVGAERAARVALGEGV